MVTVRFELSPGVSANGIPVFRVQVDRLSPVLISDTEYELYWPSPGWHTVNVSLVDANGTPMFGAQSQVQFEVIEDNESAGLSANHWELTNASCEQLLARQVSAIGDLAISPLRQLLSLTRLS